MAYLRPECLEGFHEPFVKHKHYHDGLLFRGAPEAVRDVLFAGGSEYIRPRWQHNPFLITSGRPRFFAQEAGWEPTEDGTRRQLCFEACYDGCIRWFWSVAGGGPQPVEGVSQAGSPNNEHAVRAGAGPAHARAAQALLEVLDAALDRAGADRVGLLMKLRVLHASGVLANTLGLGDQPGMRNGGSSIKSADRSPGTTRAASMPITTPSCAEPAHVAASWHA